MRLSLFLSGFFAVSSALGVAAVTEIVERDRADFTPVQALHTNDKRAICIWGICFGGSTPDYSSDVNNCGERNNCCPTAWSNGRGAQCVDGVCMPASCSNGWTLNTDTASCVNLANDVNNCGSLGNTCSLDGASAHSCSGGVCRATACVPGCGLYSGTCKDLNNDPANCGRLGNVCQFPGGTGTCSRGVCTLTSCGTGYYLSAGKCVQYNLQTDVNNCGSVGRVCSVPNGVAACSSGQCTVASCAAGYSQSGATCVAINTSTDPRNCGRLGNVCSFSNGAGTCTGGVCTYTSCSRSGYYVVGGQCVRLDLQTDPQNCGTLGKVCSVPNGLADCDCGQCVIASCATGFQQVGGACVAINTATDVKNCGRIGNVCSFTNGAGTCSNGACTYTSCQTSSGFYLVDGRCVALNLQTDPQNCGRFGNVCSVSNGVPGCNSGKCTVASCDTGYSQSGATCVAINTSTDPRNCGRLGNVCSFSNGAGTCTGGVCTYTSCSRSGYYVVGGQCVRLDLQTDPQNCGTLGKVCSVPNGLADCDCGQCVIASCATGFQQVGGACVAINTATDVKNCGRIGNVCSFTNGAGTCSNGACTYTSCQSSSGLYLVDGQCVAVNLQTDPQNCGRYGNVCSVSNGVPACSSGRCSIASCDVGYTPVKTLFLGFFLYTSCQAVDTSSDNLNCGAVGNVCDFSNGAGRCSSGVCTVTSCSPGYYLVNNKCVVIDLQTDPQNCGTLSNVCPAVENGVAGCDAGTCNIGSCNAGYAKVTTSWFFGLFPKTFCQAVNTDSDPKNCGSVGNVCPSSYLNGGSSTCRDGRCQTSCADGFDFDFVFNFCRPVSDDDQNCGRCGQKCSIPNAATQICSRGQCKVTACASGYTLSNNACVAANYQTDVNNCGSKGNVCSFSPAGASGACVAGQCVVQSCPRGYNLVNGKCILGASGRARAKRHTVPRPKTLCPAGEQACPIAGSTLFEGAASQHFKSGEELTGLMASSGGYECLDTTQALESCGGCASTGEGRDCTAIPHVGGVGCEAGQCVIFSCAEGWKRSLSGDKCIRVRARSHASHRNTTTSAARHLSRRAHRSSHHAHAVGGSSA